MADYTAISWCDSTFNPWVGCAKISPACDHCYAERLMDHRMHKVKWGAGQARVRTSAANWRQPLAWNAQEFSECMECGWRGELRKAGSEACPAWFARGPGTMRTCPSCKRPLLMESRRRVFCASLADVFDNEVPEAWRFDLLNLIADTPALDWLLLTKRIGNARAMLDAFVRSDGHPNESLDGWPNVWLGATVVNQTEADRDIPKLLATPAAVRFVSIEPMLGPINLERIEIGDYRHPLGTWCAPLSGCFVDSPRIDWVICGGESGPQARPMHPDWVRSLRDQCAAAGVPFHFKQIGEWVSPGDAAFGRSPVREVVHLRPDGSVVDPASPEAQDENADVITMARVGTKVAGRLIDGVAHDGFPS